MTEHNGIEELEAAVDYAHVYQFITNEFFVGILKKIHAVDNVVVHNFTLNAAIPAGENFGSQMVRAVVNYSSNDGADAVKKFILKLSYAKKDINDKVKETINAFTKEVYLYTHILPKVHALLRRIGDDTKLAPACYGGSNDLDFLVFEDLSEGSFANINKRVGFQHQHLMALYTKLAKYHAGTAKLLLDNEIDTSLFLHLPITGTDSFIHYFVKLADLAREVIATWEGFEEIAAKLKRLNSVHFAKIKESVERDPNEFVLLTHGDLWSNNVMFKIADDGKVEDVLMVDFQCGYHGSPVHDIINSYFASGDRTMSEEDFDLAVQHYHKTLSETLKDLNYPGDKIPTLRQLRASMFRRVGIEVPLGLFMNSLRSVEGPWTFDIEEMFDVSKMALDKYRQQYAHPEFRKSSENQLRYMDRKGLLE